jgi:sulfatase maturation enzyme AslB (radical SAM superfamily)
VRTSEESNRLSLAVVFLVSRRCNLQCTYCNVDAGPRQRVSLDPRRFEDWVSAFAALGDLELGIQLHGGEPLLLDPSVEVLSSIARNAVAPHPTSAIGSIDLVTNGVLLDADRAERLLEAGLRIVVSVDGPERIHDRHRVSASGRGSHRQVMRGLSALRTVDPDPGIIAVISQPADVGEAVRFFVSEGLSRVKINPVRPEGRGAALRGNGAAGHMVAMADAYFEAARAIAGHNQRRPEQPVYEENIAILMARVMLGEAPRTTAAGWTLLVDDRGRLWSHPGGYGVAHMALTAGPPSPDVLSRALGAIGEDRVGRVMSRQRETFRPCAGCADPMWCAGFRPLVGGPARSPDCVWRDRLTVRLEEWWQESPADAASVVRFASELPRRVRAKPANGKNGSAPVLDEPLEPAVAALLDGVRVGPDGHAYLENYADRVLELRRLEPAANERTFLQLATLACRYADRSDRRGLARSLARLARVGLEPLARSGRAPAYEEARPAS